MKAIILLAGYGTRMRPHTWSRPKALMKVAGDTVIGHLLRLLEPILTDEVVFVVGYKGDQIQEWIEEAFPQLDTHFVVQEQPLGQAHAVALCREYLADDSEVVVAFGDGIVKAEYDQFHARAGDSADAVLTVLPVEDPRPFGVVVLDDGGFIVDFIEKPSVLDHKLAAAGINWFRSSRRLLDAIDTVMRDERRTKGEFYLADAYKVLLEQGARLTTMPVEYWLDAGNPETILHTNARMLGLGHGSEDALERGYGEGFTVIPPVWIADSAEIEASVIGPYVHIDDDVVIRNAVISNAIVDPGARIADCVLDHALIGEKATVNGRRNRLFVGDNSFVDLG